MATKKTAAKSPAQTPAQTPVKTAARKSAPAKSPAKAAAKAAEKSTPKTAPKAPAAKTPPTHKEIADLAHKYFAERGHSHGSHVDDWLRAEKELNS